MFYFDQYATVKDVLDLKQEQNPDHARVLSVPEEASLSQLMNFMRDHKIGAVFIHDAHKEIIGLVTERDLISHLAFYEKKAFDLPIAPIVIRTILSCKPADGLKGVCAEMAHRHIRHMAVQNEEGRYIGIISSSDMELFAGEG